MPSYLKPDCHITSCHVVTNFYIETSEKSLHDEYSCDVWNVFQHFDFFFIAAIMFYAFPVFTLWYCRAAFMVCTLISLPWGNQRSQIFMPSCGDIWWALFLTWLMDLTQVKAEAYLFILFQLIQWLRISSVKCAAAVGNAAGLLLHLGSVFFFSTQNTERWNSGSVT